MNLFITVLTEPDVLANTQASMCLTKTHRVNFQTSGNLHLDELLSEAWNSCIVTYFHKSVNSIPYSMHVLPPNPADPHSNGNSHIQEKM